jgi:hypothetical protein
MKASSMGFLVHPMVCGALMVYAARAVPQTIASGGEASTTVAITDLKVRGGSVSGMLVNKGPQPVHDVRLLIRYTWHWNNERHPGEDNPGRADFSVVPLEIPPGGSVPFGHDASPPLPARSDGHFTVAVEVMGFTEVGD